jgi:hypothetical protein
MLIAKPQTQRSPAQRPGFSGLGLTSANVALGSSLIRYTSERRTIQGCVFFGNVFVWHGLGPDMRKMTVLIEVTRLSMVFAFGPGSSVRMPSTAALPRALAWCANQPRDRSLKKVLPRLLSWLRLTRQGPWITGLQSDMSNIRRVDM